MTKALQCKHVPDRPVLEYLAALHPNDRATRYGREEVRLDDLLTVRDAMPEGVPGKLALAKMRQLVRRGLVDGCPCGCRGDFRITGTGRAWLEKEGQSQPDPEP